MSRRNNTDYSQFGQGEVNLFDNYEVTRDNVTDNRGQDSPVLESVVDDYYENTNTNPKPESKKFQEYSRRYFTMEGVELIFCDIEELRCIWIRVEESDFINFIDEKEYKLSEIVDDKKVAKRFVVEFEKYLYDNKSSFFYGKTTKVEALASNVHTMRVSDSKYFNSNEDNLITYADGIAKVYIKFSDGIEIIETFEFADGPQGNGATPNGEFVAKSHPVYGLNENPKFQMNYALDPLKPWDYNGIRRFPTPYLFEVKDAVKKKKFNGTYSNRGSMLIHGIAYLNIKDVLDSDGEKFLQKGATEGCIGILGIENAVRFLPFFASCIAYFKEFDVKVDFKGNLNIGNRAYKRD